MLKTHWSRLLEDCRTVHAGIRTKLPYVWLSKVKGFSCPIINRLADFCNRTNEEAVRLHEIQLMTLLGLHEDLVGWRWKITRSVQRTWVGWTRVSLGSQVLFMMCDVGVNVLRLLPGLGQGTLLLSHPIEWNKTCRQTFLRISLESHCRESSGIFFCHCSVYCL